MLDSVRLRLTLGHTAILALLLFSLGAGIYAILYRNFMERADSVLRSASDATTSILARELSESGIDELAARDTVRALAIPGHTIEIFDRNGELLAERPPGIHEKLPLPEAAWRLLRPGSILYSVDDPEHPLERRRAVVSRVLLPPMQSTFYISITSSLTPLMGQFEADRAILVIAVPLIVILAGLAGWLLNRRSLAPVLEMSRQAHRIGVNDLGERLPVVNPRDELGLLAATFNDLLSRLAAALDGQRKFMADASHELRTPVSVIRTITSVNLARTGRAEQEYREALEVIDAQSRRLSRMVEDLLNLARADSGQFAPRKTPMHLDEMILETVQAASVLARDKTIRLEVGEMPEEEAAFVGDEDLLRQMVLNLLDNAIKYTPSPGTVRVGMEYADGHWLIRVVDSGRGIPTESQARIFERFYRGNPGEKQGGAGLGLSIAQWIAQLHGGVLELERSGPQGSSFLAKLPAPQT